MLSTLSWKQEVNPITPLSLVMLECVSLVEGALFATWAQELHGNLDSQREPNVEQLARFYSAWKHKVLGSPMSYRIFNKDLMTSVISSTVASRATRPVISVV
jgi:hypothetical protein